MDSALTFTETPSAPDDPLEMEIFACLGELEEFFQVCLLKCAVQL